VAKTPRPHPDKMTFLEHLEELRSRLIKCVGAVFIAFMVCINYPQQIFHFLTEPIRKGIGHKVDFIYTAPTEAFMLYMQMAFFVSLFLAAPVLLYQAWAFIAPGLYQHEKTYAIPFIFFGSLFFILGGLFGQYILFPFTFAFLGNLGGADVKFMPRITDYWSFYSWFLLALGLVFQTPVIIFVLARIGLVTAGFLMRHFKYAVLGAFIISAVITPTGDMVNQTVLAVPMLALYLVGALVAWLFGRPRRRDDGSLISGDGK
jgi:sec-independent protein translocase protein TatC